MTARNEISNLTQFKADTDQTLSDMQELVFSAAYLMLWKLQGQVSFLCIVLVMQLHAHAPLLWHLSCLVLLPCFGVGKRSPSNVTWPFTVVL